MSRRGAARAATSLAGSESKYLTRSVRLEIGARAAHWPAAMRDIAPYAASVAPDWQHSMKTSVCVLEARRTFWEKATIFHHLNRASVVRHRQWQNTKNRRKVFSASL